MIQDKAQFQLLAAISWTKANSADGPDARLFFRIGVPL
jgi:hypothetical protein